MEDKKPHQVSKLELIKVSIAVIALFIAVNEFVLKDKALTVSQHNATQKFLLRGIEKDVLQSLQMTIQHALEKDIDQSKKYNILLDMTPFHEYLVAWSACVQGKVCDRGYSIKFLCGRIDGYERLAKIILVKLGLHYTFKERNELYSEILHDCAKVAAVPS